MTGDEMNGDRMTWDERAHRASTDAGSGERADHRALREAVLITDAQEALDEQHRARVRRYLSLMAFRVPALVIAGIVFSITGNGWIALGIVVLSIPLPWVAVLMANDRPPRKRGEKPHYKYGSDYDVLGTPALTDRRRHDADNRIIDSTTVDTEHRSR